MERDLSVECSLEMKKKTKTGWLDELSEKGYNYVMYFNGEAYASKTRMKKDGSFSDSSRWDVFELEEGESWPANRLEKKFYYIGE